MPDHGPSDANTAPRRRQHYRHRRLGVGILIKRRPKRKNVNIDSISASSSVPLSEAMKEAPLPCYTLLKHTSPLLVFVPLKYQGKGDNNNQINMNLFDENPVPVWSFIGAPCLYCLMLELKKQMESQLDNISTIHEILRRAALATEVLSAVSLISIFLPHRLSFVPLIMWTPLPLLLAWPLLKNAYALLKKEITIFASNIRVGSANLTDEASLPV